MKVIYMQILGGRGTTDLLFHCLEFPRTLKQGV